jgi:hypothetical protein
MAGFMEIWYSIDEPMEAEREFWPFSPDEDEEWEDNGHRNNKTASATFGCPLPKVRRNRRGNGRVITKTPSTRYKVRRNREKTIRVSVRRDFVVKKCV